MIENKLFVKTRHNTIIIKEFEWKILVWYPQKFYKEVIFKGNSIILLFLTE